MSRFILQLIFSFQLSLVFSQKESNIWYFGNKAGIDFNDPCNPISLTDGLNEAGYEGTSTICDEQTGQLLFYTDGFWIWNRNHIQMANGYLNSNSATQTLILKRPGSSSIYYVLTPELQGNGFANDYGLRCAEVDMTLDGGLGDVTNSNSFYVLPSPVTEKLIATKHANGNDVWIINHSYNNNHFNSFLLTNSGINLTPIVSVIGSNYGASLNGFGAIGELKVSPNGQKIVAANYEPSLLELFDFNSATGVVSNSLVLSPEPHPYGLSFSPDNTKLYVTSEPFHQPNSTNSKLYQFDLTSPDASIINNSKTIIYNIQSDSLNPDFLGSLKIAPNNRIYVGRGNHKNYLGVINEPNQIGVSCDYIHNGFYLNSGTSLIGLNNSMELFYEGCNTTSIQENTHNPILLYPNPMVEGSSLVVSYPAGEIESFKLYDMYGNVILSKENITSGEFLTVEDFKKLPPSIYLYVLKGRKGEMLTGKIVI